jgi:hypothetical protein
MDYELRFIAALLHAPRNEQAEFFNRQIPKGVFSLREEEIHWVYTFRSKYGRFPSPIAFRHKFDIKLSPPSDPLSAVLQPVLDRAMYDQMIQVQEQTKKELDIGAPLTDVLARWKERASKVTEYSYEYTDVLVETSRGAKTSYKTRLEAKKGKGTLFTPPWPTLLKIAKFFLPKDVYTLVARPSMGKTWILLFMLHWFASQGIRVLLISKEMSTEVLEDRITCIRYRLPYAQLRAGELPPKILRRWKREDRLFRKSGKSYPLIFSGSETYEGVGFSHITNLVEKYKPEVVAVDGAYLLHPEGLRKNATDPERFTFISNRSKTLAKALKVLWINVLQLNRQAENRQGETQGGATTIFGSDAWYQDSDWVHAIGGTRGTNFREHGLIKGRESDVGVFSTNFSFYPEPNFEEIKGLIRVTNVEGSKTTFQGIG